MPEIDLLSYFMDTMTLRGPLVFGLVMIISAFGVPVPVTPLLLAGGAMVRQGTLEWSSFAIVMLAGVVLSDSVTYALGRFAGQWIAGRERFSKSETWRKAQEKIRSDAALAIFTSHSLITSLGLPTTIIAGMGRYPINRFLLWDSAGRVIWILIYGGLGFFLGSQTDALEHIAGSTMIWFSILSAAGIAAYYLLRRRHSRGLELT